MLEFLIDYGGFLAKLATVVVAVGALLVVVVRSVASAKREQKPEEGGEIRVRSLNQELDKHRDSLRRAILPATAWKAEKKKSGKDSKRKEKEEAKAEKDKAGRRKRVYALDFDGDLKASAVEHLRVEITSVLSLAEATDEIVLRLMSPGGMVHAYGLAASQLERIRDHGIPLTVCVDAVAASGGYMMACVADKLIAAPFAVVGSIGVVAQLPNFHRLLQKNDIDFEMITAGEYKRTLTMFGENTEKGRAKFAEEIESTQELFKSFVSAHRPQVDIAQAATGEHWYGQQALERELIDELSTSDEYLSKMCESCDVYEVSFHKKKSIKERFGLALESLLARRTTGFLKSAESTRPFEMM